MVIADHTRASTKLSNHLRRILQYEDTKDPRVVLHKLNAALAIEKARVIGAAIKKKAGALRCTCLPTAQCIVCSRIKCEAAQGTADGCWPLYTCAQCEPPLVEQVDAPHITAKVFEITPQGEKEGVPHARVAKKAHSMMVDMAKHFHGDWRAKEQIGPDRNFPNRIMAVDCHDMKSWLDPTIKRDTSNRAGSRSLFESRAARCIFLSCTEAEEQAAARDKKIPANERPIVSNIPTSPKVVELDNVDETLSDVTARVEGNDPPPPPDSQPTEDPSVKKRERRISPPPPEPPHKGTANDERASRDLGDNRPSAPLQKPSRWDTSEDTRRRTERPRQTSSDRRERRTSSLPRRDSHREDSPRRERHSHSSSRRDHDSVYRGSRRSYEDDLRPSQHSSRRDRESSRHHDEDRRGDEKSTRSRSTGYKPRDASIPRQRTDDSKSSRIRREEAPTHRRMSGAGASSSSGTASKSHTTGKRAASLSKRDPPDEKATA